MASLQELNSYQGNAELAGGTAGNASALGNYEFRETMDNVDKFTAMQFQMNREVWAQTNLEIQRTSDKAAEQLAFKYGDLIKEDQGVINEAVKDLTDYFYKHPSAVRLQIDPRTGKDNAEEYQEFLRRKQKIDHYIVRGNKRAEQFKAAETEMSKSTSQKTLKAYAGHLANERKKGIEENILTMPPIAGFNFGQYLTAVSADKNVDLGFVQILGNNNIENTVGVFNIDAATNRVLTDFLNPREETAELRQTVLGMTKQFNGLLKSAYEIAPKDKDGKIDAAGFQNFLQNDNVGSMLLSLQNRHNDYVRTLNNSYRVENGKKTGQRVREMMGMNQDLKEINITDGITEEEMVRLFLAEKAKVTSKANVQHTGDALGYATLKQGAYEYEDTKRREEKEKLLEGQEPNGLLTNYAWAPYTGLGQPSKINYYELDKQGNKIIKSQRDYEGYEVPLPQAVANAVARETNRTVTKTQGGLEETSVTTDRILPQQAFVIPSEDKDPNKSRIIFRYQDGDHKTYNLTDFYADLNFMNGRDANAATKISSAKYRHLNAMGLTAPDVNVMARSGKIHLFNQGTPALEAGGGGGPVNTGGGNNRNNNAGGPKPGGPAPGGPKPAADTSKALSGKNFFSAVRFEQRSVRR